MGCCGSSSALWRSSASHDGQWSAADSAAVSDFRSRTSVPMLFPMHVIKVSDFVGFTEIRPHQHLKALGIARCYNASEGKAVFVSHQWCGGSHPDPYFRQLRVLQGLFVSAAAGSLRVDADILSTIYAGVGARTTHQRHFRGAMSWYMWYDYFSVPQPDVGRCDAEGELASSQSSVETADANMRMAQAISSLPVYVSMCEHFFILAPRVQHEEGHELDLVSWKTRGWCRLERLSRVLLATDPRVFLVRQQDLLLEVSPLDCVFEAVGTGTFTCEEDRPRLSSVVRRLFNDRLARLFAEGRLHEWRCTSVLRTALLEGLPSGFDFCRVASLEDDSFLNQLYMSSPTEDVEGTTPLLLATRAGKTDAMQALIEARASIDCAERRSLQEYGIGAYQTPMHAAAWHGHDNAIRLLLHHRASVDVRNAPCCSIPLHHACATGKVQAIEALIEHRADVEAVQEHGVTPIFIAAFHCRGSGVRALLAAGASCRSSSDGLSPSHVGALMGVGPDTMRLLLAARASVTSQYRPHRTNPIYLVCVSMGLIRCYGRRSYLAEVAYHCWGATPLMLAALAGNVSEALLLLESRSDPEVRNYRGRSATALAREHLTAEDYLLLCPPGPPRNPQGSLHRIAGAQGDAMQISSSCATLG
mmetsp:Transcript_88122/g.254319  ORF Transcript_88122/g.254319 Transcript_88122/m.254319 type:complete len:644 (-) Transcript_88122:70-2001(-)